MPTYEISTDKGTFEIDADRAPTNEEAAQIISSHAGQSQKQPDTFKEEYLKDANKGVAGRAEDLIKAPLKIAGGIGKTAVGGLESFGNAAQNIADKGLIKGGIENVGTGAQSLLEAGVRVPYDVGSALYEKAQQGVPKPSLWDLGGPLVSYLMKSKDTSDAAIEKARQSDMLKRAIEEERNKGVAPEVLGKKDEGLTEAISTFAPIAPVAGKALNLAKNGLLAGAEKLGMRRLTATPTDILTDVIKPTASEETVMKNLQEGKYEATLPEIKKYFKPGSGTNGAVDAIAKVQDEAAKLFRPAIKNSAPIEDAERINMLDRFESNLASDIPNAEIRKRVIDSEKDLISIFSNVDQHSLLDEARFLNKKLGNFYKHPENAAPESIYATKAARDVLAQTIRARLDAAGVDPQVYSKYGLISDLQDQIAERGLRAETELSALRGKGVPARTLEGVTSVRSTPGAIVKGTQNALSPVTGAEAGRLDRQINKLFNMVKAPGEKELTAAEKALLLQNAIQNRPQ